MPGWATPGLRAGDAAGQRAPGAHGDGRHAAARQRRLSCCSAATTCSSHARRRGATASAIATTSPGRWMRRRHRRSRSSIRAASAPSSSTAASSTSTRLAVLRRHAAPILTTLARALNELGVPHPIHVHGCNLGVPGNVATTLATIARHGGPAAPSDPPPVPQLRHGRRPQKFSSGAARIAERSTGARTSPSTSAR